MAHYTYKNNNVELIQHFSPPIAVDGLSTTTRRQSSVPPGPVAPKTGCAENSKANSDIINTRAPRVQVCWNGCVLNS